MCIVLSPLELSSREEIAVAAAALAEWYVDIYACHRLCRRMRCKGSKYFANTQMTRIFLLPKLFKIVENWEKFPGECILPRIFTDMFYLNKNTPSLMATKILKNRGMYWWLCWTIVHHSSASLWYPHSCKHGFGIISYPSLAALLPIATNIIFQWFWLSPSAMSNAQRK